MSLQGAKRRGNPIHFPYEIATLPSVARNDYKVGLMNQAPTLGIIKRWV